jgi:transmembrane sensor
VLFRVLKGLASAEEQALVLRWRSASSEHEARFEAVRQILAAAARGQRRVVSDPPVTLEILEEVARRREQGRARSRWRRVGLLAAATAAVALLAIGTWAATRRPASLSVTELVTGPDETSTISLTDGTVVRLGGSSQLRFDPKVDQRAVRLKGRAYFAVAKQHGRPFRVETEGGNVVVLGTRFDVDARAGDLRTVVVEGRVAVSAARGGETKVAAGQMARVVDGKLLPTVRVSDASGETGWVGRFLAFQNTPLRQVARDIERAYGVKVTVDSSIAERTVTTWLADRPLDEVLRIICGASLTTCSQEQNVVSISGS